MLSISFKSTLAAFLLVASVSNAQFTLTPGDGFDGDQHALCDNPYDPNCQPGYPGNPYDPGFPDEPDYNDGRTDIKTIYISRSVSDEVLDLRRLAGLGNQYRGWEIVSVRGRTRPNSPYTTTVQLLADGRNVATQVNPGKRINLVPNKRLVLDKNVRELELYISGSTVVDEIKIEIRRGQGGQQPDPYPGNPGYPGYPGYPGNPGYPDYPGQPADQNVELYINQSVYNNDRIDLGSYFNMQQYYGYRIERVVMYAQAQNNVALAELLINGFNSGTFQFDRYSTSESVTLHNRPEIGGQANSLVLYTRGNMYVQRVTLVLSRY